MKSFKFVAGACMVLTLSLLPMADSFGKEPVEAGDGVTVLHNLRYRDGASKSCVLDLALPPRRAAKPRPAVLIIHGGGWLEGDKSSFVVRRTPGNILDFASLGFVAAAINYRLSGEDAFPAGLYDCQCAVRWLRAHAAEYHIDPSRMGAYGNSAGGHLALLLGMIDPSAGLEETGGPFSNQSSRVQAVVSDSGPIDLLTQYQHGQLHAVIERFLGGPPDGSRLETYKRASPVNHLAGPTPPLLLIYGETDEQVDVKTADQFVAQLSRENRTDVTYLRLAKVGHCPHSLKRVPFLRGVVIDFFVRTLGKP